MFTEKYHTMKTEKLDLSDNQRQKALELATKIDRGKITKPQDIVDEWEPIPDKGLVWGKDLVEDDTKYLHINTERLIGTARQNIERLEKDRMLNILEIIWKNNYKHRGFEPPQLVLINGRYYVNSDGNHRALAHKALDTDDMYAKVTRYVMKN